MKEYLLSTNEYSEPAVLTSGGAYGMMLLRLLLLQPGSNPLHPGMGVGLGPKYRYITSRNITELETLIQNQINTYLPTEFGAKTTVKLEVKKKSKYLKITIVGNDTKYVFDTEKSDVPIELSEIIY